MNMTLPGACVDALRRLPGFEADVEEGGLLRLNGRLFRFRELPRGISPRDVSTLDVGQDEILLLPYADRGLAEALREAGIPFVDAAGNAWISRPPFYLAIEGRKRPAPPRRGRPQLMAGGLQVVFVLLTDTEALERPYRDLAREAGVALGTVANTVAWLRDQGHVVPTGNGGLLLAEHRRLRERWELGYVEVLRRHLDLGRFRPAGGGRVEDLDALGAPGVLVGGELAASVLTETLLPAGATLHVHEPVAPVLRALRLIPDPEGPVALLRRFGEADEGASREGVPLAHPLLVRAELLAIGDARLRETADRLLDQVGP